MARELLMTRSPTPNDASRSSAAKERLIAGKAALSAAMQPQPGVFFPETRIPEGVWENKVCEIASGQAVCFHPDQSTSVLSLGDVFGVSELFSGRRLLVAVEPREVMTIRSINYAGALSLAAQDANVAMWLLYYVNQQAR